MRGMKKTVDYKEYPLQELLKKINIDYKRETGEEDAIKELGNEFEEEEIRLVRIKFLSEMGN